MQDPHRQGSGASSLRHVADVWAPWVGPRRGPGAGGRGVGQLQRGLRTVACAVWPVRGAGSLWLGNVWMFVEAIDVN